METSFRTSDFLFMMQGAWVTLQLTLWAMVIGTVAGAALGMLRVAFPRTTVPLGWILDVFRSVPLLIQFVLFNALKSILGLEWTAFAVGCIVLGIYCTSYCTEIVRGGVLAVAPNVIRAARSLGMNYRQAAQYVMLPMATRVAFPSWINLVMSVMKDTSLVLWIGIIELLRSSQIIVTRIQEPILVLGITGLIYYVMSFVIAHAGAILEKRWKEND